MTTDDNRRLPERSARNKEIRSLTGLRGVAALYVVIFHFFFFINPTSAAGRFFAHGYLSVDLFFALSGFVMAMTYRHLFAANWTLTAYRKFMGRRLARIYPLYFFTMAVVGILIRLNVRGNPAYHPHIAFVWNLLMIQVWALAPSMDSPAWSISAEFAAYLLFPLLLVPTLFRGKAQAWLMALGSSVGLIWLALLPARLAHPQHLNAMLDISNYPYGLPVYRCIFEFTLGLLAYRVSKSDFGKRIADTGWFALTTCGAILALLFLRNSDLAVVFLFLPLIVSLVSDKHLAARLLGSPVSVWLGAISYSIYLVHGLLFELMQGLERVATAHHLAYPRQTVAVGAILLSLVLGALVHRLLEVPARQYLRHLFEGGREPRIVAGA